ncbi:probable leucine-rich repeat receptor-like serine/threonine-protein kinase At3g14840 isoform X2 [Morus notabilis]|uniref:probable leucine-rich repeat receptor-like serine/threonine-protein kinase At3g14840 isoform X2 n=1 Tax=Morus notabilis TaxID=981085 RepID=UPI000CED5141|nr:probable leucine-rich repeat receptor-like serine/threonine-protein kinase At3g14840 isoform X2 [Morus notabilis]
MMIKMFFSQSPFLFLVTFFYVILSSNASAQLPKSEVEALREIAKTLGKTNWNFSVDPCSGDYGWVTKNPVQGFENAVSCNRSFCSATACHVTSIVLKAQSLPGTLPKDLLKLPYLQEFDLSRNYLNGTIPPEWGSSQLVNISLLGNRLTGSIPKELANITTLKSLVLEINRLSGNLPPELGNLSNIERFLVTSNNFTGELPETLGKLTTLKDFRIGDNSFSGKIPSFIQKWTKLQKLAIQASGLSGPIPSSIALLEKLSDLRISDLSGSEATFPPLNNMTKMKTLILRNCNLNGTIPDYLGEMSSLKTLDLSFNKLSGNVPNSLASLSNVDYIFLTGNLLSGEVAEWLLTKGESIDLSYNNFTVNNSSCQQRNVNLFASSSQGNNSKIVSCLTCYGNWYSLHINCGGKEVTVNGTTFESDTDSAGPSNLFVSKTNWAVSTTGYFADNDSPKDSYTTGNLSSLTVANPELYMNARLSPISLTYYAFCLGNGNYTVKLHFAEIMFTNDTTYSSLGRRLFDVYIQGKLVLKDFNIADEAGQAGKAVIKNFTAVVTSSTLDIRFYWAGKGTTAIPNRGVYGPLISAISVNSDFQPPSTSTETGSSISVGAIVGIVVGSLLVVLLIIGVLWRKCCQRRKTTLEQDLKGVDLKTGKFTLRQIKAATNNFDVANKIGEGGFGPVYKGVLYDGAIIAVKQLSSKSKQGNREFLNEIGMISAVQHPHLVKLYGCCIEGDQLLLVYEYMKNNNVARALFGPEESQLQLDWPARRKICVGIARGLAYLHEESRLKIVHRDIKSTNVLLDKDLNPKISDFGLAKLDEEENSHISTRIAGTYGYMAPEYAMRGYLTDKADVYSYGIVVLEIISGKGNTTYRLKDDCFYLLDWALLLKEEGNLIKLVDPRLGSDYDKEEVLLTINVALLCANVSAAARPTMSSVVSILEGKTAIQELIQDTSVSIHDISVMRKHNQIIQEGNHADSQTHSMSIEGPWTGSSSSAHDLYPLNPDSDYWQSRN